MTNNLDIFRKEFLEANSWSQRKDGVPLDLLDNLTDEEQKTAEIELIKVVSLRDNWPIIRTWTHKIKKCTSDTL